MAALTVAALSMAALTVAALTVQVRLESLDTLPSLEAAIKLEAERVLAAEVSAQYYQAGSARDHAYPAHSLEWPLWPW